MIGKTNRQESEKGREESASKRAERQGGGGCPAFEPNAGETERENESENGSGKPKLGLRSRFALPDAFWSEEMIIWRNGYFSLRGCRRILSYSGDCIRFRLSGLVLTVTGSDLICLSFEGGEVTLGGTVREMSFSSAEVRG